MIKALIVDDDFYIRRLLRQGLEKHAVCKEAADGSEAIEAFKKAFSSGGRYDLILLDIMMPRMDGHTALRHIRQVEEDHQVFDVDQVKVIMITALGDSENVILAGQNDVQGYLLKPFQLKNLIETINRSGFNLKNE